MYVRSMSGSAAREAMAKLRAAYDAFAGTDYSFSTDVEVTGSLDEFSDADLAAAFDGLPLARTPEELAALGVDDPATATLTLQVALPDGTSASSGEVDDGVASWQVPLTGGEPTSLTATASSSVSQRLPLVVMGVGAVLVVAGLVAAVLAVLAVLRARR